MVIKSFLKFINESMTIDDLKNQLTDINDILLDLRDYEWIVNISYVPKRWEKPTYKILSDFYTISIQKKKNLSNDRFPAGSDFKFKEIEDYILRLDDYFKDNIKKFNAIVDIDKDLVTVLKEIYKIGYYKEIENDIIYEKWFSESELLGFKMDIYIDGENLDGFKYHELPIVNESIRSKYIELGVNDYYKNNKLEYKNPHSKRVIKSLDYISQK